MVIVSASHTRCCVIRWFLAHPTMAREYRSITTAKYSTPSSVQTYVMSVVHFRLGVVAQKSCLSRSGATEFECFESVVTLNFLA